MWTLDKAIKLIRDTQNTAFSFGYHICLGGGVLNRGNSEKDLDIYFLPLVGIEENFDGLIQSLYIGWGEAEEFGYGNSYNKVSPYRTSLRFVGKKKTDAFQGTLEVFIV